MARGESGQTSAEYAGALVVVAAVIAALAMGGVGEAIADGLDRLVCRVAGGECENEQPRVQRLAGEGPAAGPPVAGRDIAILPFPGSVSITCGHGEANERACTPKGPGVRADARIGADRSPTTLDSNGCPQQSVSLSATFQLEHGQEGTRHRATGRLARYVGHTSNYSISARPDQIDRMRDGDRSIANPVDPRTIARGESVQMSEEFYAGLGMSTEYRALQASLGYDRGRRISSGVQRVDDRTMRVYVGDEDFVRSALSVGVGGVSASFGRELADGKLRAVDIDIHTQAGWDAYQAFVTSGRPPERGAPSTGDPTTSITHRATQSAGLEAQFGNVVVGGLLTDSEGNYTRTRSDSGRVKHELTIRHDDVGLAVEVEAGGGKAETRKYALNLKGVDPEVYANFQALNGGGDTRAPAGGNVRMQFTGDDLMAMRRQALEHIAFQLELRGVEPRPTPGEVADMLERDASRLHAAGIDARDLDLAGARNPQEVVARLYRWADGDPHQFLTGPLTEFINRTSFAHGDSIGSSRNRLPGSVGAPRCSD